MYENEPRLLFNYPLSGCVGIVATAILVSQIFCLMFYSSILFYFIEISICFSLVFVLSVGVRQRKVGFVTAYVLFLCTYAFWITFDLIFFIWFYVYAVHHQCPDPLPKPQLHSYHTGADGKPCYYLAKTHVADLVLAIISTVVSLLLSVLQFRYCLILYRFMRQERLSNAHQVSYQHRPPNSPPQYQQPAAPWPEKPPGYAEAASHLPPNYGGEATASSSSEATVATTQATSVQQAPSTSSQPDLLPVVDQQVMVQAEEGRTANQEIFTPPAVFDSFVEATPHIGKVLAPAVPHDLSDTNPFRDELTRTG